MVSLNKRFPISYLNMVLLYVQDLISERNLAGFFLFFTLLMKVLWKGRQNIFGRSAAQLGNPQICITDVI